MSDSSMALLCNYFVLGTGDNCGSSYEVIVCSCRAIMKDSALCIVMLSELFWLTTLASGFHRGADFKSYIAIVCASVLGF